MKYIIILVIIVISGYFYWRWQTERSFIVMCDIGQGDGIYIRTDDNQDILIDTGKGREILNCVSQHMGLVDKTIELVMISHAHADHYGGYRHLAEYYDIKNVVASEETITKVMAFQRNYLSRPNLMTKADLVGGLKMGSANFTFHWGPNLCRQHALECDGSDENNNSFVATYSDGQFDMFLTGDSTDGVITRSLDRPEENERSQGGKKREIEVLKVSHHGSRTGLSPSQLSLLTPEIALISAGIDNSYGHPHSVVVDLLKASAIPYVVTNQSGEIYLDYSLDGQFSVRTSKNVSN